MTDPETIEHLLVNAYAPENFLGRGENGGRAYAFPKGSGLEAFVLRTKGIHDRESLWRVLSNSTQLTPTKYLVKGMNIGQPLFGLSSQHGTVTIHLRQPGTPLTALYKLPGEEIAPSTSFRSYTSLLQRIQSLHQPGRNPFTTLLDNAYLIEKSGYAPDFGLDNLLFDAEHGTLGLVDQLNTKAKAQFPLPLSRPVDVLKFKLSEPFMRLENAADANEKKIAAEAIAEIGQMIDEAKKEVLEKYRTHPELGKGIGFAKVADTSAVALDQPPHILVERLNAMKQVVKIPAR